jgi:phenylalanyl-tRNA synthetase beta chain
VIAGLISPRAARHWGGAGEDALFGLKGDLMALLEQIGAPVAALQLAQGQTRDWWHPGRSARLQLGPKTVIAEFGAVHPRSLKALDADGPMLAFEIVLDTVPEPKARPTKARGSADLPNLMPLTRDFAFVVEDSRAAGDLVFDVYRGAGVPEGSKSIALEVVIQPREATLTEADIEGLSGRVVAAAEKLGARLRS